MRNTSKNAVMFTNQQFSVAVSPSVILSFISGGIACLLGRGEPGDESWYFINMLEANMWRQSGSENGENTTNKQSFACSGVC